MRYLKHTGLVTALLALAAVAACSKANVLSPSGGGLVLTAPAIEVPGNDELVASLRPTLSVRNGTANQAGTRTYEFQLSTATTFSPVTVQRTGIPESIVGTTSFSVESDLQISTLYYWRARFTQGSTSSEWSATGRFRTSTGGYNRPGELYDPLTGGNTVGTPVGSTTFLTGRGIRINDQNSYVRYALPQTMSSGEFSMEVEGLYPNGPGPKLKVFSMFEGTGNLTGSRYEMSAQYRGSTGNPDNAIAFKVVLGGGTPVETDSAQRTAGIRSLNPAQTYFWQASWSPTSFRLVVRDGGIGGSVIYDLSLPAPSASPYAPSPHYAYLGATSGTFGTDTGSWPMVIYRNVWLSDKPRPASLGGR